MHAYYMCKMDSSDSPLVRHLLHYWLPARQTNPVTILVKIMYFALLVLPGEFHTGITEGIYLKEGNLDLTGLGRVWQE